MHGRPSRCNCEGDKLAGLAAHVQCELPAIYAQPLGWTGVRAPAQPGLRSTSRRDCTSNTGIFRNLDALDDAHSRTDGQVAQLVTPETAHM